MNDVLAPRERRRQLDHRSLANAFAQVVHERHVNIGTDQRTLDILDQPLNGFAVDDAKAGDLFQRLAQF